MAKANSPSENVRALQRALYVAAKRNGRRKFPALLDRVARPVVLQDAWKQVRRNEGAAGIDGETLAALEAYGVERMLEELRELLLTADPAADESHLAVDVEGLANRLHLHLFCGKELGSAAVPLPQPLARRIGWSFVEATAVVIECVRLKASSPIPLFDGGAADTEFAGELGAGE